VTAESLLRALATALGDAGIPFMLTGSLASAYHGAGRATWDLDLVIDPQLPAHLETFVRAVENLGMYVSEDAAREALARHSMFNVVDIESGWKADLLIMKPRAFSREEFGRRLAVQFLGVSLEIATLEDVIISKLEWAKLGESGRQLEDVASLLRIRRDDLDAGYVERWVRALGLDAQWSVAVAGATR
jgi:hypothetical protein